ncbi:hypothetical protein JANAI62_03710 [Jannaschia pagri]|uniref:Uncharacterized protein n=2 Tax=Jannaschia TaxID=188905 RepID=A0ABQ4NH43_9RHOB|nr:hypothetical protein [Jannaschia sp. AI_62]GIT90146.1 hypothetical protein JANAI61_06040 [Jannaschia sp. AI_61]GIT93748.1 hypothetical protein JANAI62_03710 [Jannaschia sp. AI_62]
MLQIMNAALLAQGQHEILSEGEGSDEYRVLVRSWPRVVEAELEDGNYHFTRETTVVLARQAGAYGFTYGYSVPAGALHVRDVYPVGQPVDQRRPIDWLQDGRNVYAEESNGVSMEITYAPGPDEWSATFTQGIQKRLEAIILRSLKEEYGAADRADQTAEMFLQRARTSSSKSRTAKPMFRSPGRLMSARRGRGG